MAHTLRNWATRPSGATRRSRAWPTADVGIILWLLALLTLLGPVTARVEAVPVVPCLAASVAGPDDARRSSNSSSSVEARDKASLSKESNRRSGLSGAA